MSDHDVLGCEEAIRLLAEYLDGELEDERRADMEQHLDMCRSCYSRREFEKGLKDRVSGLGAEAVRPDFDARIRSLVASFVEPRDDDTP